MKITKHVCGFISEIFQPTTANLLESNGWIFTNKEKQEMCQDFQPVSIKRFNSYIGTFKWEKSQNFDLKKFNFEFLNFLDVSLTPSSWLCIAVFNIASTLAWKYAYRECSPKRRDGVKKKLFKKNNSLILIPRLKKHLKEIE